MLKQEKGKNTKLEAELKEGKMKQQNHEQEILLLKAKVNNDDFYHAFLFFLGNYLSWKVFFMSYSSMLKEQDLGKRKFKVFSWNLVIGHLPYGTTIY